MRDAIPKTCQKRIPGGTYNGKQGSRCFEGIAQETTGAQGICMRIPPGGRAKAHLHEAHETAIYVLERSAKMSCGEQLDDVMDTVAPPELDALLCENDLHPSPPACDDRRRQASEREGRKLLRCAPGGLR